MTNYWGVVFGMRAEVPVTIPVLGFQGFDCCSSLAQGLVIKQKALLLALVMQLTWQLDLRASVVSGDA